MKRKFLSIILINVTLFFALIAIHEISHVFIGYCLGCESEKAVLFDSAFNGPHTELICGSSLDEFLIYIGGLVVTSIFSLGFAFLDASEKNLSFISLGVSMILGSLDMQAVIPQMLYPILTSGFILVTLGEYFTASSYMKGEVSLRNLDSRTELLE